MRPEPMRLLVVKLAERSDGGDGLRAMPKETPRQDEEAAFTLPRAQPWNDTAVRSDPGRLPPILGSR
jgi:hypothetical protein